MQKPKNIFRPDSDPKNRPLGPKRAQNDHKKAKDQKLNKQKKKTLQNKSYQSIQINLKNIFQTLWQPQIAR